MEALVLLVAIAFIIHWKWTSPVKRHKVRAVIRRKKGW
jgi:hypothetical protein